MADKGKRKEGGETQQYEEGLLVSRWLMRRRVGTDSPYKYVGKEGYYSDADTGLMKLGARYYDPVIGRFITQDLARDGLNWYAYADDNHMSKADPNGERPLTVADKARLHTLYNYAGQNNVSMHMINRLVGDLKLQISTVPSGEADPVGLSTSWWAIDRLGNKDYSAKGRLSTGVVPLRSGAPKCNAFVADALHFGGGVPLGDGSNGGIRMKPAALGLRAYPPTANDWANTDNQMDGFEFQYRPFLTTGAVYARHGSGSGHCGIYLGAGVAISGSTDFGVRLSSAAADDFRFRATGTAYRYYNGF